jgi:hypothetical protein
MNSKNCSKKACTQKNPQLTENFHKNKSQPDGFHSECKICKNFREAIYRLKNKEIIKIRAKKQRDKNPHYMKNWINFNKEKYAKIQKRSKDKNRENIRKKSIEYYYKTRNHQLELGRKRRKENLEKEHIRCQKFRRENKGIVNAKTARRRAIKLKATPNWLTKEQKKDITFFYIQSTLLTKELKMSHEVDHILPLQGKEVCGLHVPWNLQILSEKIHRLKGNRILKRDLDSHKDFIIALSRNKKLGSE